MNNNASNSLLRLLLGIGASIGIGIIISQQVDLISTPLSVMVGILTAITGIATTKVLNSIAPRREKPSRMGGLAMILFLAAYVVVGKILWDQNSLAAFLAYTLAGSIYIWLVFTSIAETALMYAIGLGGFCSGFIGIVIMATVTTPFRDLMFRITSPEEKTTVYCSIGLICAFAGAFAAITGRLSGFGLAENKNLQTWTFDSKGKLVVRKD